MNRCSRFAQAASLRARLIPEPGQSFVFHGFRFDILRRQRNQITALKVTPMEPADETPDSALPTDRAAE